jgi:hypothetical protein
LPNLRLSVNRAMHTFNRRVVILLKTVVHELDR